ncbi:MAG: discoidin domain-containing protein, partial [bacterium]|nr:discoidin domain-containing protein [bacterium]
MWNDDQPLLPVHLIDGDPETAWSSRGGPVPKRQPEWIRIDLPAETTISGVGLVCSKIGPGGNFPEYVRHINPKPGKALPKEITVKISCDGMNWETVYENKKFKGPETGPTKIEFEPKRAKQIWIIGEDFPAMLRIGHAFSIGGVEVYDTEGNNQALISRGSGVQVSSSNYGYGMDRFTQKMLWPVQYDLGFKWTRVGYDMGMFLWSYVEREKGKLQIDPEADAAVTEAFNNGINVILCLDKSNWLYHDPPRKTNWKKSRIYEMMETYFDHQGWPDASDKQLEGYLRYVDYMVRHFKGKIAYYEICNEWNASPRTSPADYARVVKATIPVIKKADPDAKIMLGATGGIPQDIQQVLGAKSSVRIN